MQVGTSHLRLITVAMDLGATETPQECRLVLKTQMTTGELTSWKKMTYSWPSVGTNLLTDKNLGSREWDSWSRQKCCYQTQRNSTARSKVKKKWVNVQVHGEKDDSDPQDRTIFRSGPSWWECQDPQCNVGGLAEASLQATLLRLLTAVQISAAALHCRE